jgi:hypothetical protein
MHNFHHMSITVDHTHKTQTWDLVAVSFYITHIKFEAHCELYYKDPYLGISDVIYTIASLAW